MSPCCYLQIAQAAHMRIFAQRLAQSPHGSRLRLWVYTGEQDFRDQRKPRIIAGDLLEIEHGADPAIAQGGGSSLTNGKHQLGLRYPVDDLE